MQTLDDQADDNEVRSKLQTNTRASRLGGKVHLEVLPAVVLVLLLVGVAPYGSAGLSTSVNAALVDVVLVVGLYIFIGTTGILSFGHLMFMATGSYVASILMLNAATKRLLYPDMYGFLVKTHLAVFGSLLAGALAGAVVALAVGAVLMRLSELNAAMGSFVLLLVLNVVSSGWSSATNGTAGVTGIPPVTIGPLVAWALVSICAAGLFARSRLGLAARATREDQTSAAAVGIDVFRVRLIAFVLSGAVMGLSGGLFAQVQQAIQPDAFYLDLTFLALAMLIVGGMTSLFGAVLGVVVLWGLQQFLGDVENGLQLGPLYLHGPLGLREVGTAIVMLLILVFRPRGLAGRGLTVAGGRWAGRLLRRQESSASPE